MSAQPKDPMPFDPRQSTPVDGRPAARTGSGETRTPRTTFYVRGSTVETPQGWKLRF